jgi:hypothetical protein
VTVSPLDKLRRQQWPANKGRSDFWQDLKQQQDMEPRKVICAFCGGESPMLTGPEGRAWFARHDCSRPALRLVKS